MKRIQISMLAIRGGAGVFSGCTTCPKSTDLMQAECVIETQESNVVAMEQT